MAAEKQLDHDAVPIRFSALPRAVPDAQAASRPASPLLASAWVGAILRFWETAAIDVAQPLYLFDPAPGDGQLAWLVLHALRQALAATGSQLQPCYVACGDQIDTLDLLSRHPQLASYVDEGRFDTALMRHGTGKALTLRCRQLSMLRTANPVVLLAHHWFSSLPCELHAADQGRMMEGMVTLNAASGALDYAWQALADTAHGDLLADCAAQAPGVAWLIPGAACGLLDDFCSLAGGRYLLLSEDHGCHTPQQLRLGMVALPPAWDPLRAAQPVNHYALSSHQRQQGAWTWNHQLDDDGVVLHAACKLGDDTLSRGQLDAILAPLATLQPGQATQLLAMASTERGADASGLLCLLQLSGHDTAVLAAGMPALLEQAHLLGAGARGAWRTALHHTWNNYLAPVIDAGFHCQLGILAARLGDWGLAKHCFSVQLLIYGDSAAALYNLACCEVATGGAPSAMRLLERALALDADDECCRELWQQVTVQQQRHAAMAWYHADIAGDDQLTLEPLGASHAAALLHQYRDHQIGILTRLPALHTLDDAKAWIAQESAADGRYCCAVMHAGHGFIGVVSMQRGGDGGYFYFWIGSDFQDQGWGRKAANLLFTLAAKNGIADLFTSVYQDNTRSRRTLDRLGFRDTGLRAAAPDDDLLFLHLPLRSGSADIDDGLRRLCAAIGSPFVFLTEQEVEQTQ
jgi:RimJ/RimL family protein N-acetyltransferase